ncbi:MAG: hypothetical protein ACREJ2_17270, partial [Planctomycetota bacterium]
AASAAPEAAPAHAGAAVEEDSSRISRTMQAVQCRHCHHLWRIDRSRMGKTTRCPNCGKDTVAAVPENLIAQTSHRRLIINTLIVLVLLSAFGGAVAYFYQLFQPADLRAKTVHDQMQELATEFKSADFDRIYTERFSATLKKNVSRRDWEKEWELKMLDRQVIDATLDTGKSVNSPIDAQLNLTVRRVTGAHEVRTYPMHLRLIDQGDGWKIDSYSMK